MVVIGFVILGVEFPGAWDVTPAKSQIIHVAKNILEFDDSVSVQGSCAGWCRENIGHYLPVDRSVELISKANAFLPPEHHAGGRIYSLRMVFWFRWQGGNTDGICANPHDSGWRTPVVFNHEINSWPDRRPLEVESGGVEDVIEFGVRDEKVWPVSHEQPFVSHFGGFCSCVGGLPPHGDLPLASVPQFVRSSLKSERKSSNRDGGQRGNNPAQLVKNLNNLDADEWNDLIRGAIFLLGLFGFFAYFIVTRDERKNQNDKSRTNAEPK